MASPSSSRSNASSTKQLLDELDDLMQRMLELPVNESEEEKQVPPPIQNAAMAARMPIAANPVAPTSFPSAPTLEVPSALHETPHRAPSFVKLPKEPVAPASQENASNSETKETRELSPPTPRLMQVPTDAKPKLTPAAETQGRRVPYPVPKPITAPASGSGLGRYLLLTPNWIFDAGTYLLGPAGAWLRGSSGRFVLGLAGVLMVLGAAVWGLYKLLG